MRAKVTMFATALVLAAPVSAEASEALVGPQLAVSFADLDLATDRGIEQLNRRILAAARSLCPADPGLADLSRHRTATVCIAETLARTRTQIVEAVTAARLSRDTSRQVAAR